MLSGLYVSFLFILKRPKFEKMSDQESISSVEESGDEIDED